MNRETFQAIRDLLMEKLDMSREMTDREILDEIDQLILNRMRDSYISLNEKLQLRQELFYSVRKLDVLQELIEDDRRRRSGKHQPQNRSAELSLAGSHFHGPLFGGRL